MADCGKCLHLDVCKTAETCDGRVPRCKHFMDKNGMALASCKLGTKGCFTDGKCRYKKACENKVITRADQIRAMTDGELADWLARTQIDNVSEALKIAHVPWEESAGLKELTTKDCLEWLQEPVEEGAT